ncbi:hypothetical protein GPX89_07830 [Nocardia sp. ET3-3]|uniref:Uncharacterized protein n=1 Tax=Nocardia terrae TaxID=2675851 RepID=A0A7K1US50_9NOCA|nr:hypothetical protein [Nocardia terrae]MVU77157.1 hypothetical protein [Nocardia terrae]
MAAQLGLIGAALLVSPRVVIRDVDLLESGAAATSSSLFWTGYCLLVESGE